MRTEDRGLRKPAKTLRFPVPVIETDAGVPLPRSSILNRRTYLLAAPVIAILLWVVVYPNVSVIAGSLADGARAWHGEQPPYDDITFVVVRRR